MSPEGPVTSIHYNAGFIVLSYIVSLIGCITTIELLHRKTSRRGAYNWFLLISSCVTMGGVGVWCMHFIGNRAIVLDEGQDDRQIVYSMVFTALSFFLPILVLLAAFYIWGITDRVNHYYITTSSVLAGTAICGMHYVGQLGISNYRCTYRPGNMVGAAIIAIVASKLALSVFFRLRETWTDSWWKRILCGAILACAVSGMHWTATVGTRYNWKGADAPSRGHSRIQTVIVCTILSVITCIVLLSFSVLASRKKRLYKTRAQQLVLACGYFDDDGRVMVTPDGFLPCAKITNHYVEKTFGEDELSRTHPTFVWVFKASRNWSAIRDLIPQMQASLDADPVARRYQPGHTTPTDDGGEAALDFSVVFKQLFCVAAQHLANILHEPLDRLGVLFEEPLETCTVESKRRSKNVAKVRKLSCGSSSVDSARESIVPYVLGKGQFLTVTRHLVNTEVDRFTAMGYRFAAIKQIAELMAKSMQVPPGWMIRRLERMRTCGSMENLLPPGIHLASFMIRPSLHKSFDVLVPVGTQNQLPVISLAAKKLTGWQTGLLRKFDEWTVAAVLKALINESGFLQSRGGEASPLVKEQDFRWDLYRVFSQLIELVGDPATIMQAKFSAKQISAPCRTRPGSTRSDTCILFSVRAMCPVNTPSPRPEMEYVPLSFFSAQQQMEADPTSHENFTRSIRREFGCSTSLRKSMRVEPIVTARRASVGDLSHTNHNFCPITPTSTLKPNHCATALTPLVPTDGPRPRSQTQLSAETKSSSVDELQQDGMELTELKGNPNKILEEGTSPATVTPLSSGEEKHEVRKEWPRAESVDVGKDSMMSGSAAQAKIISDFGEVGTFVNELFGLFRL